MISGLGYMHAQGFTHRDIKPENILLTSDFVLKLADFGFSSTLEGKDKTGILHTKLGTEGYMAPEIQTRNYISNPFFICFWFSDFNLKVLDVYGFVRTFFNASKA